MNLKLTLYRKKERIKRQLYRINNGSCIVLLYHRIINSDYDPQGLCVSIDNFKNQLTEIKNTHTVLTTADFFDRLTNGKRFPKKSVFITFDDGYADNYLNAVPVLENLDLQAMFYISLKNINTNSIFWWDEIDLIFQQIEQTNPPINHLLQLHQCADIKLLYAFYINQCKLSPSVEKRENYLNELRQLNTTITSENYRSLTQPELIKMSCSKSVTIGAHTINHLSLGHLTRANQQYEIETSVIELENILSAKIKHFSFPYGEEHNYNTTTIEICKHLALSSAAANYQDDVTKGTPIYSFPRFVVRNVSASILIQQLNSIV